MSTTARMVMKIIGASLAFAAFVCLLIGGWHDIGAGYTCVKNRMNKRFRSEYDDYDEEDSIGTPVMVFQGIKRICRRISSPAEAPAIHTPDAYRKQKGQP